MLIGGIYFLVIFLACVIGAIVGLGGGVFIRPIFDTLGFHNALNIQFFASVAILFMAVVSTIKKTRDGTKIKTDVIITIAIGAIVGGAVGNIIVEHAISNLGDILFQKIQAIANILILLASLFLTIKSKSHKNQNPKAISKQFCVIFGVLLGLICTFLSVGGGTISMPIFMMFFVLSVKQATAYSIAIMLFSHLSRLVTMGFSQNYSYFDLTMLLFVIPAAVLGGLVGAKFSKIFSDDIVKKSFITVVSAVILLNIVNLIVL